MNCALKPRIYGLLVLAILSSCSQGKPDATSGANLPASNQDAPTNAIATSAPTPITAATGSSSTVTSPFQLNLNQSALNEILLHGAVMKSLQGEIIQTLPDATVGSPFSVAISGVHLDLKYNFNTPTLNPATQQWEFTTKEISAEVTVDSITAHESIRAGSDAASITVNVNASCSPVHMTLPAGSSQASGVIQLGLSNGLPTLKLTSFTPVWTPGAWQISALNCEGAQGFGDLVTRQAAQMLSQVNPFVAQIQDAIQNELTSFVSGPIHFAMDVSPNTSVSLAANSFSSATASSSGSGSVVIQGEADFSFNSIPESMGCAKHVAPYGAFTAPTAQPSASGNMLSLPLETVQALVTCAYYDHMLSVQFSSSEVPAFKSLVDSWIEDILVWPSLLSYPSGSIFAFNLNATRPPVFTNARSIGNHMIALDAELPLSLDVNAPSKSSKQTWEPYVHLETNFVGSMKLNVANSQASVRSLDKAAVKLDYQFDPFYLESHAHTDQRIWLQPIQSAASNFLTNNGISLTLPTLKVGDGLTLIPESADLDQGNVDLAITLSK